MFHVLVSHAVSCACVIASYSERVGEVSFFSLFFIKLGDGKVGERKVYALFKNQKSKIVECGLLFLAEGAERFAEVCDLIWVVAEE